MKNILVFPCGSEVALEVHRAVRYSRYFKLIGASSVDDHGRFIFENYVGNLPFHDDKNFISELKKVIQTYNIDAIYPAMDLVAFTLKKNEKKLGCKVVGSSLKTTQICSSKKQIYTIFKDTLPTPFIYENTQIAKYPIFIKPEIGYGSRNTYLAKTQEDANNFLQKNKHIGNFLLCEFLPYSEYTIDCFSTKTNELLCVKPRKRARIVNGISVNTYEEKHHKEVFERYAKVINEILKPQGAWFFQMKEDENKAPKLLEIAARFGGSSSLFRAKGINFALLSLFDFFGFDVKILENSYKVEMDRAFSNKYKIDIKYNDIYVDYDDCLIVKDKINHILVSFLYKSLNENKKITLITKHSGDLHKSLKKYRLENLFDKIHHLAKTDKKSDFITSDSAIFIDDSHKERQDVANNKKVFVFSPDMIEALL